MTLKRAKVVGAAMFGSRVARADLHPSRQALFNRISKDPWAFMTAVDPLTNVPLVWTRNERSDRGKDPFPDKDYLRLYVEALTIPLQPDDRDVLWVPKSRQMIISTATLVVCLWEILFGFSWRTILSKVTEDEAEELLENKVRFTYKQLPEWLRSIRRIPEKPKGRAECLDTSSYILAAAQNAADRECRGGTANRVVVDEACYQDYTKSIVEAGGPMTNRLVLISTPNFAYPGGRFMRAAVHDEDIGI